MAVFLRELISNASDACDRLRYDAIARPELLEKGGSRVIRIRPDAEAGTLIVSDTGIGMDRQELIDNLGTVARSGTRAFVERLAQGTEGAALIGQFGVRVSCRCRNSSGLLGIARFGRNGDRVGNLSSYITYACCPAYRETAPSACASA
jgi:hypothetical protein